MLLCAVAWLSGCATAPFFRPQGPPLDDKSFEIGVGPHAMFGRTEMGVGGGAWMHAEAWTEDIELVARAHAADFFRYDGQRDPNDDASPIDVLYGGSAGLRGRYRFNETLMLGGEALIDFQSRTGSGEHLIAGIVGFPVAERAAPGFWVYTNPSIGLAIPLHDNPIAPFFGFQEIPLGVAWQPMDWLLVVGEGGFSLPLNGGYGGVAVAFRL